MKTQVIKFKLLVLAAFVLIVLVSAGSQAQDKSMSDSVKTRAYQVSFVPMFGTSRGPSEGYTNKFSFNMLMGREHSLDGFELSGIYGINTNDVKGVQLAGIGSSVGGNAQGIQLSGVVNTVKGDFSGAQYAGFANINQGNSSTFQISGSTNVNKGHVTGGQLAGHVNIALDSVRGVQGAGLVNVAKGSVKGAQLAGLVNRSDSTKGAQIAGLANVSKKGIDGTQIAGLANRSEDVNGVQLAGIYNRARNVSGSQVGLINVADSLEDGLAVGLINISRNGIVQPGIEHNDVIETYVTFRSGNEKLYTILLAGRDTGDDYLWSYGAGLGTQFNMKSKFVTNFEITAQQISPEGKHADYVNILNRVSWNFGYRFAKHLGISAGPALNIYVSDQSEASSDVAHRQLGQSNIYDEMFDGTNVRMWIGYNVAIKF